MTYLLAPPPNLPPILASNLLQRRYGIEGTLSVLVAERDLNFRVETQAGDLLLKILPEGEGREQAGALAAVLQHVAMIDPSLKVPRVSLSVSGNAVENIEAGGATYNTILLSWLPGRVMADVVMTAELRRALGIELARLGRALRGFMHPAVPARQLAWNVMTAEDLLPSVHHLGDAAWQAKAEAYLKDFRDRTKPQLMRLRAQVIHGDAHPWNVLVDDDGQFAGTIDFGDMVYAPLVIDPANTIADCFTEAGEIDAVFEDIISAYTGETELEEDEVDIVPELVAARLLTTAVISRRRLADGLANTEAIARMAEHSLEKFSNVQARQAELVDICRGAAGLPRRTTSANMLSRRKAAMGANPLLFYDPPLHIVKGEGMWLTASDGRKYLDCYNNVPHVGHAHPHVARAVAQQLRHLNTNTRYLTDQSIAYAERLKETLHPSLDTVVFVNSGSEANDVAIRMAKVWSGHAGGLCMEFAYHGVTEATDAISPSNYPAGNWKAPHIRQLEAPDGYRGAVKQGAPNFVEHYAGFIDQALAELQAAGIGCAFGIVDSAFMTNGIPDVPMGYVATLANKVHAAGGLFIADEVQSGFGRMGTAMWGHQHHGVVPDFVTIGKPAGNGFPIGVVITRAEIHARFVAETGPFFSTFGGNNAACAAGLAVLDIIEREGLVENARVNGEALRRAIAGLASRHRLIGDVRGTGLAIGVELVRNRTTLEPAEPETKTLLNRVRDQGVLIGRDGKHGNVLKIRPPLAFAANHTPIVVQALDLAMQGLL